ncbi:MAG: hypothetical protein EOP06_15295 [Proteobacteria bacterium]|nr:MAG: hypothetical protein EOP06_15295 [Pseudomonadota bacterium]
MISQRMIAAIVCLLTSLSAANAKAERGGMDAGGGDIVRCNRMGLSGFFTLDYALMVGRGHVPLKELDPKLKKARHAQRVVREIFGINAPRFLSSFDSFFRSTGQIDWCGYGSQHCQPSDVASGDREWNSSSLKLKNLNDEGDLAALPQECKEHLSDPGSPWVVPAYQAVIRTEIPGKIVYNYGVSLRWIQNEPYQLSFLLMHEWLRDFTNDPEVIRNVTWLLHTRKVQELNVKEFNLALRKLGLKF